MDSLEMINLSVKAQDIPDGTAAIQSISDVKVKAARSLCEKGAGCKTDGTIVTIEAALSSCVNSLGPVAYKAEQTVEEDGTKSIKLTLNAVEFVDQKIPVVFCGGVTTGKIELSLPMLFGSVDSIKLQILE